MVDARLRKQLYKICNDLLPNINKSDRIDSHISKDELKQIKDDMLNFIVVNKMTCGKNKDQLATYVDSFISRAFRIFPEFNGGIVFGSKPYYHYVKREDSLRRDGIYKKLSTMLKNAEYGSEVYGEIEDAIMNRALNVYAEFEKRNP